MKRAILTISLLFMASVMFPLILPEGMNIDKLLRAQIAIILFAGANLAEVVRGGLQALPKGQFEAADAMMQVGAATEEQITEMFAAVEKQHKAK